MEHNIVLELQADWEAGEKHGLRIVGDNLKTPEDYDWAVGPREIGGSGREHIWVVYKDSGGQFWIGRSDQSRRFMKNRFSPTAVPSGATSPRIEFNADNEYVLAFEFLPAGASQTEIWIFEPPYAGSAIRKIADGQKPIIWRSPTDEMYVFYQHPDQESILYRSGGFTTADTVPLTVEGWPFPVGPWFYPVGMRTAVEVETFSFSGINAQKITYTPVLFVNENRYITVEPIQVWSQEPWLHDEGVEASAQIGLDWQQLVEIEASAEDSIESSVQFGLEWQTIPALEHSTEDTIEASAGVDVDWMEIVTLTESAQDDVEGSAGLDSILWVQVSFFTITFDENGGDTQAEPTSLVIEDGEPLGSLPTPPTRTGHTFVGWNTAANGTGDAVDETTIIESEHTVYAQWEEDV